MLNSYRLDIFVVMCVLRLIKCMGMINTAGISLVYYSYLKQHRLNVSTVMRSWNPSRRFVESGEYNYFMCIYKITYKPVDVGKSTG